MPTSAIKDLLKKWVAVRAMILEWHPNQAGVSRTWSRIRLGLQKWATHSILLQVKATLHQPYWLDIGDGPVSQQVKNRGNRPGKRAGYVKPLVYADKPQTLDHLEDNIHRVIADIRPQMLEKVIENWTSGLDYIRASRGSSMSEIIFKM
ncbi:hypothetical protein TNCV_1863661 [Trichonephila clavipes]|nr:hypothetical protein TNCV_1863661 [Trichonephila clavipes]